MSTEGTDGTDGTDDATTNSENTKEANGDTKRDLIAPDIEYNCDWWTGRRVGVSYFNWRFSALLFGNWVLLAVFDVLVDTSAAGITCGTGLYWGLMFLTFPLFIVLALGIGWYLHRKYLHRKEKNYEYGVTDLKWTYKRLGVFMSISFVTGVLAALFGLGGGTLNSPTFLELGVLPAQVPATSGILILLTSSVALIQYIALGKLSIPYFLWFIFVGFLGGVSGHLGIRAYIKKYKKQSAIVFFIGGDDFGRVGGFDIYGGNFVCDE